MAFFKPNQIAEKIEGQLDDIFKGVTKDVFNKVVDLTPVETGELVGNFGVGNGDSINYREGRDPTKQRIKAEIENVVDNADFSKPVYLGNRAEYAGIINGKYDINNRARSLVESSAIRAAQEK